MKLLTGSSLPDRGRGLTRFLLVLACVSGVALLLIAIVFRDKRSPIYFAAQPSHSFDKKSVGSIV